MALFGTTVRRGPSTPASRRSTPRPTNRRSNPLQAAMRKAPSNAYKTTSVQSKMVNPLRAKQDATKTAPKGSFKTAPKDAFKTAPKGSFTTDPIQSKMMTPKSAMKTAPTGGAVKGIPGNISVSFKNSPIMQELAGRNKTQSVARPTSGYQKQQTVDAPPPKRTVLMDTDQSKVTPPTVAERIRSKIEGSKEAGGFKVGDSTTIGPISNPIDKKVSQENQRGPARRKGKYGRGGISFKF